ncbi:MAG: PKD domain-containing protein [Thermoplasmatota archaeon]
MDTLGNGDEGATVAFPAPGSSQALNISLQTGLRVLSARLNLSGLPYTNGGTDCPLSPSLDLGADGSVEWRFEGTGYGPLGHQSRFSSGGSLFRVAFPSGGGTNSSMAVRLPAGASLNSFRLDVEPSGFLGPSVSLSLDVGADGTPEWSSSLSDKQTIMDLESAVESYMGLAAPAKDAFGVRYIDVPIRVSCGSAATLDFTNLSAPYDCTIETAELGSELDRLLPDEQGNWNVSIPLKLSAASAGRVRVEGLRIVAEPPHHPPEILAFQPASNPEVRENSSVEFSVITGDMYGNPVTLQWYLDAAAVPGATQPAYVYSTDFNSSGRHTVTVLVENGLSQTSRTWQVTVTDVNRPPRIESQSPYGEVVVPENSTREFSIVATDPDGGELSYVWMVEGEAMAEGSARFLFSPGFRSAGEWTIEATATDAGGLSASASWRVRVTRTNMPPFIVARQPATDPELDEGTALRFSVVCEDVNGDSLSGTWFLDGLLAGLGMELSYAPDFFSSGVHELKALVHDGELSTVTVWSVTVRDINRAPVATIDRPREGEVLLDTDSITFDATSSFDFDRDELSFTWLAGGALIGHGPTLHASLPRGNHTVRLMVEDGRGGRSETALNLSVRHIGLMANLSISPAHPTEGERMRIVVAVVGEGDAPSENVVVALHVDGVPTGSRVIPVVEMGRRLTETFYWTAEPGRHELVIYVGNSTITTHITVARGLPAWFLPVSLALFGLALAVGVTVFYVYRRAIQIWAAGVLPWWNIKWGEDEAEARGARPERRPRLSLKEISLDHTPYKDRPLEIQTTMPPEMPPEDVISEQLTVSRRRRLRALAPRPAPAIPARSAGPDGGEVAAEPSGTAGPSGPRPGPAVAAAVEAEAARAVARRPTPRPVKSRTEPAPIPRKPKRRMTDIEDRIHELERKGVDVTQPRRYLSLAKSFWKGGNPKKSDQYLQKAEESLGELEGMSATQPGERAPQAVPCPKCGAPVEPGWIVCPQCEARIK